MRTLYSRFQFFKDHSGCVGRAAVYAMDLARAEARAEAEDLECSWEDEVEPWDGDSPAPAYLLCGLVRTENECASLGMVGVNRLSDPYLRVVAAELFSEVFAERERAYEARAHAIRVSDAYTSRDAL